MNPTPAEIIDGVRRILKEVVEPHVESPYAVSRLAEIRAVLAQVDWNNSLTNLVERNVTHAKLGEQLLVWVESRGETSEDIVALEADLRNLLAAPIATISSFEAHNARCKEWDNCMVGCSDVLIDWLKVRPEDARAKSLLDTIHTHYSLPEG